MKRTSTAPLLALSIMLMALLACAGGPDNLRLTEQPRYICPSATPRPTDTPHPTSMPTYPFVFLANLDYYYVDVSRSTVSIQYVAQNTGDIQLSYAGLTTNGQPWSGSQRIGFAPYGAPGVIGVYLFTIPPNVTRVDLTVLGSYAYAFTVNRLPYPLYTAPNPVPCCLPAPVHPTAAPTYTPYPTPTPYVRTDDYFVGDPVYALTATLRIKFRVTSVESMAAPPDKQGRPRGVYVWRLEVKNIGNLEYNLYPAVQMYVSEVRTAGGETRRKCGFTTPGRRRHMSGQTPCGWRSAIRPTRPARASRRMG